MPHPNTRKRPLRRAAALAALAAASACTGPGDGVTPREAELLAARARWDAAGPAAYSVREVVGCFCPCPREFTAIVSPAGVVGVTDVEPWGTTPPDELEQAALTCARTVDDVFDEIAANVEADRFEVEYDGPLGYPTSVAIDPSFRIADEEVFWELRDLAARP